MQHNDEVPLTGGRVLRRIAQPKSAVPESATSAESNQASDPDTTTSDAPTHLAPGVKDAGLVKNTAVMAVGTLTSRILGFLRLALLTAAIGVTGSEVADAFAIANKIPTLLYNLIAGGMLNAVLVPQIIKAYKRGNGQAYVDRLITMSTTILLGLTLILTSAAALLISLYTTDFTPGQHALAVTFALWCLPQIFFYGLFTILGEILNSRGQFAAYAWAPVVNNIISIAGLAVYLMVFPTFNAADPDALLNTWTSSQTVLLAGITTLGIAVQALILIIPLRRSGFRFSVKFGLRGVGFRSAGTMAAWTFAGIVASQLSSLVVANIASAASGAGNAAYDMAYLIFMLPNSVITFSLATAMYTRISGYIANENYIRLRADFANVITSVSVFTVFAAVFLVITSVPVVQVISMGRALSETIPVSLVLIMMALGIPAFGLWIVCLRILYAFEKGREIFIINVVLAAIIIVGGLAGMLLLPATWWTAGVGGALSLSSIVGTTFGLILCRRLVGPFGGVAILHIIQKSLLAVLVSAVFGAAVVWAALTWTPMGFWLSLTVTAVTGIGMLVIYLKTLSMLGVSELDELINPIRAKLKKMLQR